MQFWLEFFSIVSAIALLVQVSILAALFFEVKRTMAKVNQVTDDLNARVSPMLTRMQLLLDDTQPKITSMVNDASHVVYLARDQAQKVDRLVTDASDRLRGQLVHADRILTNTLEAVEDAGIQMRRSVLQPVRKASAFITGIKAGLDLLRARSARSQKSDGGGEPREQQEEELFI
jgi:G3E family GTPase